MTLFSGNLGNALFIGSECSFGAASLLVGICRTSCWHLPHELLAFAARAAGICRTMNESARGEILSAQKEEYVGMGRRTSRSGKMSGGRLTDDKLRNKRR